MKKLLALLLSVFLLCGTALATETSVDSHISAPADTGVSDPASSVPPDPTEPPPESPASTDSESVTP